MRNPHDERVEAAGVQHWTFSCTCTARCRKSTAHYDPQLLDRVFCAPTFWSDQEGRRENPI